MNQHNPEFWANSAQELQQTFADSWAKALQSFQTTDMGPLRTAAEKMMGAAGMGTGTGAAPGNLPAMRFAPEKLQALQQQYMQEAADLWTSSFNIADKPAAKPADKRFASDNWASNPVAALTASTYLLNARTLMALADAVEGDAKTRARLRFAVEQWMAASAPSNFLAFNVDAQKRAIETKGESIAKGLQNLLHDVQQGHVSMTDESQFEVGRNVATTEGAVVFENELFQLIEYKPLTAKVFEKPFLLVPPCINKFYILDLQPDNSMIRHLVAQGHRTFVVSWRNPDASLGTKTWDDYIENAAIKAIEVTREITQAPQINALGFCVGGTILTTALAVLAARATPGHTAGKTAAKAGSKSARLAATPLPVASLTLLTTLLDFSDTGILDLFIDEAFVAYREKEMGQGGLMKGSDLASTFSFLRPNDLVWNYVVGNYLKGETPPPFDLLYWNSDSTNLPGPFNVWYLRNTYLENNLVKPGKAVVCGETIDFGKLDLPVYVYGSREDHIVPIAGAYASTQHLPGKKRFVMGASGHIAGVINPPAKNKRSHWIGPADKFPAQVDDWIASAKEHPGSWWADWTQWLSGHAGKQIPAPKIYGDGKAKSQYKVIEPAPGRYVKAKA